MPDRIIRDEILTSERWVSLKDNADRLAYMACLLTCDTLGNMEAGDGRLMRLWRDFGINSTQLVAKTITELLEHDLVRPYDHLGKRFLHLPRFKQRRRWLGRLCPLSPWTTDEDKQKVANYSQGARPEHAMSTPGARPRGVGVGVGVGEERGGVQHDNATTPAEIQNRLKVENSEKQIARSNPIKPDETLEDYAARIAAIAAQPTEQPTTK